ncbi:MAG: hypothetical protein JSW52_10395 [Candidatus Coatesbacteria bacterium]|nr:MAG: hypothetical protein JSW52_10395 [Candidatus Coatesbacteria bacterium]
MGKLITVAALLAVVSSASALGVGISVHYNVGIPIGDFADVHKVSVIGTLVDVEFRLHPFINVVAAFGYQQFKPKDEVVGIDKTTVIPIQFGVEYPAEFRKFAFYPGGGMSYNLMKTTGPNYEESENKIGAWFGGNFYYCITSEIYFGPSFHYHIIFTEPVRTGWLHIDVGIKYWFM